MKYLLLLLITFSFNSFSNEIVWSYIETESLKSSIASNPAYLVKRIGLRRIDLDQLGIAVTPFYYIKGTIFRDYKDYRDQCYRLKVESHRSLAAKTKCTKKKFFINFNGKIFKEFDEFSNLEEFSFGIQKKAAVKTIQAFHHEAREILPNLQEEEKFPFGPIDVQLDIERAVTFSKSKILVNSNVVVSRSKYTYLSEREKSVYQSLDFEPSKRDFVFINDNEILLYKRFQPRPFEFRLLSVSQNYVNYLGALEDHLFEYEGNKRCFKDNLYNPHQSDCDKLIFKDRLFANWKEFGLLLINIERQSIQAIKSF